MCLGELHPSGHAREHIISLSALEKAQLAAGDKLAAALHVQPPLLPREVALDFLGHLLLLGQLRKGLDLVVFKRRLLCDELGGIVCPRRARLAGRLFAGRNLQVFGDHDP